MKQLTVAAAQDWGVPVTHAWHSGAAGLPAVQQALVPAAQLSCTQPGDADFLPITHGGH